MESFALAWFLLLGAVIGSFLNVVIIRTAAGEGFGGRSRCRSCDAVLAWRELVPVVSWLLQGGRCRRCKARVSARYLFVELTTTALFGWIAYAFWPDALTLGIALGIGAVLVVVFAYDLEHLRIPDGAVLLLLLLSFAWVPAGSSGSLVPALLGALLGSVLPAGFLGGLWWFSRGRWVGLGDVKLVVPLGLVLGFAGSISMLLLAFWVGALFVLVLLALQRFASISHRGKPYLPFLQRSLTMKSEVPFAPFIIVAFLLVWLAGVDAFSLVQLVTTAALGI